jgi:CBS domain-containing protein
MWNYSIIKGGMIFMKVKEIMTKNVEIITPETSLKDAASRMQQLNIGVLPVSENDRIVGMITDRDITIRGVANGKANSAGVGEVMTPKVLYCMEDDDLAEAGKKMKSNQVRRLIVLNKDKRITGIISLGDLVVDSGDELLGGEILQKISEPSKPLQ